MNENHILLRYFDCLRELYPLEQQWVFGVKMYICQENETIYRLNGDGGMTEVKDKIIFIGINDVFAVI